MDPRFELNSDREVETLFGCDKITTKDEWLTPPGIIEELGPFDLDPSSPIDRPWPTAANHFTIIDNGLKKPWAGRVWCNPPYGNKTGVWLGRCKEHGNAIALTFARTETKMFFDHVWPAANAVFLFQGRLKFYSVDGRQAGSAGAPSILIAYGEENADRLESCNLTGKFIKLF